MLSSGKLPQKQSAPPCQHCAQCRHCLPGSEPAAEMAGMQRLIQGEFRMEQGESLYTAHDPIRGIFVIRSGFCKSSRLDDDGSEQVLAFHFPGDFIGFDALDRGRHRVTAEALDATVLCHFDPASLEDSSLQSAALQSRLLRIMSRELAFLRSRELEGTAEARAAHFIAYLANRLSDCGFNGTSFRLPMPRRDIASYLKVAPETISRALHRLADAGMIRLHGRQLEILDSAGLRGRSDRAH